MKRSAWILIPLLILSSACHGVPPDDPLDQYIRSEMQEHAIPSVCLAVIREGAVEKTAAYGTVDLEWDIPADTGNAHQLASATKLLTSTVVMQLVQEKRLDLNAPISHYLPDLPGSWVQITLRHLMMHQSGIPMVPITEIASMEEALAWAMSRPLEYEPGTKDAYSSADFTVLQHILERVQQKEWPQILKERVLEPLGMNSSGFARVSCDGFIYDSDLIRHRARVFENEGGRVRITAALFPEYMFAAGGLFSTIEDLAKWAVALDNETLLSDEMQQRMIATEALPDGSMAHFTCGGWVNYPDTEKLGRTTGHSGGPALADILRYPDHKLTVIVLCNQQNLLPHLAAGIAELISNPRLNRE